MPAKITIRSVEGLAAEGQEEVTSRDSALSGFEVRARKGGAKVYAIRYRAGTGRDAPMKRYTIGKHGSPWTPETARTEARRLLALVAQGKDPAGAKAAAKAAPTGFGLRSVFHNQGDGARHRPRPQPSLRFR